MDKLNNILNNFSFSQAESELYLACLKLHKATVSEIAEKAGVGRTVAYFHIKNLIKRNILKQLKKNKKIIITPVSPSELAERLQEQVGDFKSLIPKLENLSVAENEIPQIEIEDSKTAFEKIYDEVINMPIGSMWKVLEDRRGAEAELKLLDNTYWANFFSQMATRKILTKAIFTKELLQDVNKSITPENYAMLKKRQWDVHTISEELLPIKNFIVMYNNKISFMFPEISMTITIRHAALYYIIDTMFETIFALTEKVEAPWGKPNIKNIPPDTQTPQKATEEDIYY
ncbi:MAG: hypothetical protein ACD_5C00008G0004 [uncultured bacterium]|nr:MAG: hypothetical protein ACD_5C00008G0004 [uncultured bacterium]